MKNKNPTYEEIKKKNEELEREIIKLKKSHSDLTGETAFLRNMFENAPLPYQSLDQNGCFIEINQTYIDLVGYSKEELLGKWFGDILTPQSRESFKHNFEVFKMNKTMNNVEYDIICKNGTIKNLVCFGRIKYDRRGKFEQTQCILQDITLLKKAKNDLEQARVFMDNLIQTANTMVIGLNKKGDITIFNRKAEEITGYSIEDMKGRNWFETLVPRKRYPQVWDIFTKLMKGGLPKTFENPILTKSGEERIILWRNNEIRIDGKIKGTISFGMDITKRKQMEKKLRESEEKYISLVENSQDIIVIHQRGIIQFINSAIVLLTGHQVDDLMGKSIMDYIAPPYHNLVKGRIRDRMSGKNVPHIYEVELIKRDGTLLPVEVNVSIIKYEGKTSSLVYIRDISSRKKAERLLMDGHRQLESIFKAAPIGIGLTVNRIITMVNERFTEIVGYSRKELIGKSSRMIFYNQKEFERVGKIRNDQIKKFGTETVEAMLRNKKGTTVHVMISSTPLNPKDLNMGLTLTVLDITKQKKTENEVIETTFKLRGILDSINDPIRMIDRNKKIIWANDIALKTFGQQMIGKKCYKVFDTKPNMIKDCMVDKLFVEGGIQEHEHDVQLGDGEKVTYWCTGSVASRYANGKPRHVIIISRDITEKKKAEKELKEKQIQMAQAQKMEAIGQLAGGIAHDFNNLLAVIMSHEEVISNELSDIHPVQNHLEEIDKAVVKASNLVRKLLAFSRREMTQPVSCNINHLILDLWKMMRRVIGENIEIVQNLASDIGTTQIDINQFEQVILNLVINARDALPNGGKIEIKTRNTDSGTERLEPFIKPGRYVKVSVSDNGIGMDEETKKRIFEPFFSTKDSGTGLGLSTCYGIIKQNSGNIIVDSKPNEGSSFHIYFPFTQDKPFKKATKNATVSDHNIPKSRETILLVEDEESLLSIYQKILRSEGYTVLQAPDGEEALKIIRDHRHGGIDLIFSDMVMPKVGGINLANKARELLPNAKIILTSGYSEQLKNSKGKINKDFKFLTKPIRPSILLQEIRKMLDKKEL